RPSLNPLWAQAERQVSGWQSIAVRLPERPSADVSFTIDTGDGGQPQKRATLTLEPATGAVKKWETFSSTSAGRQLRSWTRFSHTGEYYGLVGQTIAGIASFAAVMLVWTGITLSLRRFSGWRARRSREASASVPVLR
ncbi:MAG: PepSY-associated TM helix domain-containing protein, partial [Bryobacteraceae bacterium]